VYDPGRPPTIDPAILHMGVRRFGNLLRPATLALLLGGSGPQGDLGEYV